jgi:hypothetical protein
LEIVIESSVSSLRPGWVSISRYEPEPLAERVEAVVQDPDVVPLPQHPGDLADLDAGGDEVDAAATTACPATIDACFADVVGRVLDRAVAPTGSR